MIDNLQGLSMYLLLVLVIIVALGSILILKSSLYSFDTPKTSCFKDEDCGPATCCHANKAINKVYGSNCLGVSCTEECKKGTIDCGCGRIACVSSKCSIVWTKNNSWC
ncbi:MAG: hypothetical protein J4428_02515 [Candidatus Aenigmarchaeota archaeon]|nr:hypothetical protein [Candidatus Aenigmarchaeota archaeon]